MLFLNLIKVDSFVPLQTIFGRAVLGLFLTIFVIIHSPWKETMKVDLDEKLLSLFPPGRGSLGSALKLTLIKQFTLIFNLTSIEENTQHIKMWGQLTDGGERYSSTFMNH